MKIIANINQFSYPILVGTNILKTLPQEISKLTKSKKVLVVIDNYLSKKYRPFLQKIFNKNNFETSFFKIIAGKKCKDYKNLLKIVDFLEKNKFSKDSTMVVLGGGTIGDLGGFAASVFYRGMNLVSIPTTLTAQIDSSIGGKVAVNFNNNISWLRLENIKPNIDLSPLKTLWHCDSVLKKQGMYYFCDEIKEVSYEETN